MGAALLSMILAMAGTGIVVLIWIGIHLSARHRLGEERLGCHLGKADRENGVSCCRTSTSCDLQACNMKREDPTD